MVKTYSEAGDAAFVTAQETRQHALDVVHTMAEPNDGYAGLNTNPPAHGRHGIRVVK